MVWGRRKRDDEFGRYGYEDKAALTGVGGYEPADPADATPSEYDRPAQPYSQQEPTQPGSFPQAPAPPPEESAPRQARPWYLRQGRFRTVLMLGLVSGVFSLGANVASVFDDEEEDVAARLTDTPSPSPPPPEPRIVVPAAVDGWQPVPGGDGAFAYDVPPSWSPEPDLLHGWEADGPGRPRLTLSASALLDDDFCGSNTRRGGAGITTWEDGFDDAASGVASAVAGRAYGGDGGDPAVTPVEQESGRFVTATGDELPSSLSVLEVTPAKPGRCVPERALVGALAVEPTERGGDVPVLVVYAHAAVTTTGEIVTILESFRGVAAADRTTVPAPPTS